MSSSATSRLFVAPSLSLISIIPSIDGDALVGAFAGAALVVVTLQDVSRSKRFVYMFVSLVAGYLAAPEVVSATPLNSTGVAAFLAAALAITVTLQLMERIRAFDLKSFIRKR